MPAAGTASSHWRDRPVSRPGEVDDATPDRARRVHRPHLGGLRRCRSDDQCAAVALGRSDDQCAAVALGRSDDQCAAPAAIADAARQGAVTIGADLAVVEAIAGTTLDTVSTSLPVPLGTKGTRSFPPAASWAVDWAAYAHGPSGNVPTTATGAAYYVGCHQYWGTAGGDTFAAYPAAVIQVQKG
jgi:hypothetical protein